MYEKSEHEAGSFGLMSKFAEVQVGFMTVDALARREGARVVGGEGGGKARRGHKVR